MLILSRGNKFWDRGLAVQEINFGIVVYMSDNKILLILG